MNKISLFVVLLFLGFLSSAQEQIASPQIISYTSEDYKAGLQNWDIAQDKNGILYFGNNEGLLTFNGKFWTLSKLPNFTAIRSVEIDSKNRIFVGGQGEAGYFFPNKQGVLTYHSITDLIPKQFRNFADIWNLCIVNDEVVFRTINAIIHYKDGIVKAYRPEISWEFAGAVKNQLFAHSMGTGLMIYDHNIWKPYCNDPILEQSAVTAIMEYSKDTLLVSTLKNGLFLMHNKKLIPKKTSLDRVFYNDRIYYAKKIGADKYLIGTTSGGVIIMDRDGNLIQQYAYHDGLQSNNIRSCILDSSDNLWLALNDGIDYIAINSAVKNIFPDKNKQVTSYAIASFNQHLYIGTSNGLYVTLIDPKLKDLSLSKGKFTEVKNTKGQVWNLDELNNQLVMGHEEGLSVIENDISKKIYTTPGTWMYQPVSNVFPSKYIIAGSYLGLQKIGFKDGGFTNEGKVSGLTESLRFIAYDENTNYIWASHPYHGIYRIEMTPDYKKIIKHSIYTNKHGLPSLLYNYVFKVKNQVVVATASGVYEYDSASDRFVPSTLLNNALKGLPIQYLKEDNKGNIWFVTNKKVGILDFNAPTENQLYTLHYFPQLDGKLVGGFETIYFLNNENVFLGANKGAHHLNYTKYLKNISKPTLVMGVVRLTGKQDSVIFGGYFMKDNKIVDEQDRANIMKLNSGLNSLHFEYSSTLFEHQRNIEYSYQLEGFDKKWSGWMHKSEKDYTNLPAGKYVFKVKARNSGGNESKVISYTFEILPAWYDSTWMYVFYLLLMLFTIYQFFKWQKKKYIDAQAKLSYLHQLEMDRSEKEIVRLEYEKLETDVDYKNRELSTMTMHLVQRGKVLSRIKEVISSVIKNHDITDSSPSFRHLIRLIRDVEKSDQDWDNFSIHFNTINADFFNKLKDHFPDLTPNELKLSAYLKMNLSTKEIAQLMNITIKAVEVGRYRLRKKLRLQPDVNLYDFLISISRAPTVV